MNIEAAILVRVSEVKRGKHKKSITEQKAAGRRTAGEVGWHVSPGHEFSDENLSASSFAVKARPGWESLRRLIEAGWVKGVIFWSVNRASREMEDWSGFLRLCERRGVLICVVTHGNRIYDCSVPHDWKLLVDEGVDADYDSRKRALDIRRGIDGHMAAGKPWAAVPQGYRRVRDRNSGALLNIEPDPVDAPKVRLAFEMADQGHSLKSIEKETGIPRRYLRTQLRCLTYIARRRMGDGTLVECIWDPIVDEDLFWRVQGVMDSKPNRGRRPGGVKSLLSHMAGAECGQCGAEVVSGFREFGRGADRKPERYYTCQDGGCLSIRAKTADDAVAFAVTGYLIRPGVLERHLPRSGGPEAARAADAEAGRLRAELDSWLEAGVSARAYKAQEDRLLPLIAEAEARASQARASTAGAAALSAFEKALHPLTGEETEWASDDRLNAALDVWEGLPLPAARELLRTVAVVRIYPRMMAVEKGLMRKPSPRERYQGVPVEVDFLPLPSDESNTEE